ncbi:collagen alpha-1(XIV) chain-like [Lycodopsis pacificus]
MMHPEDEFMCKTPAISDIVILVDGSGSIGLINFRLVKTFLENLVRAFSVEFDKTRIGLAQYSGDPRIEWHLNAHTTKEAVIEAVKNLPYKGGDTMTGLALTFILETSFKPEAGSRPGVPKIGIVITDGTSNDDVIPPARSLREAGIELFAIGVKDADENELKAIASPPEETHVYNVADFSVMSDIVESLTKTVCDRVEQLDKQIKAEDEFMCKTPAISDIVILVDGSWSIGLMNFRLVKTFLENLVRAFSVEFDKTRIGLAQYSGDPRIEWHLNAHTTKEAVIEAVKNLPYKGGDTMTGLALTFILETSFKPEAGSRPGVPKIGIVIIDGMSTDDVIPPARSLREAGIELFAIGVKDADENELKAIASPPEETHVYNVADFSVMSDIVESLTKTVCDRVEQLDKQIKAALGPSRNGPQEAGL